MTAKKPMSAGRLVLTIIASIVGVIVLALALCLGVPYYMLQSQFSIKESPAPATSEGAASSTGARK